VELDPEASASVRRIVHDLNNSVSVLVNYAALLAEDLTDRPELAGWLGEMRRAGQRAGDQLRHLNGLLFGRPEQA
jgi:hypothetical protein